MDTISQQVVDQLGKYNLVTACFQNRSTKTATACCIINYNKLTGCWLIR